MLLFNAILLKMQCCTVELALLLMLCGSMMDQLALRFLGIMIGLMGLRPSSGIFSTRGG